MGIQMVGRDPGVYYHLCSVLFGKQLRSRYDTREQKTLPDRRMGAGCCIIDHFDPAWDYLRRIWKDVDYHPTPVGNKCSSGFPVYEKMLEKKYQVLLLGRKDKEIVAYGLVEVDIPDKDTLMNGFSYGE